MILNNNDERRGSKKHSNIVFLSQDLYRWWFEARCSKNKMSVVGRSWSAVVKDPRYKAKQG